MQPIRVGVLLVFVSGCSLIFDGERTSGDPSPDTSVVTDAHVPVDTPDYSAACSAPEGPAIALASVDVAAAIAGRWYRCGGADEFNGQSIELTADGQFYLLTLANGAFVRNYGATSSGTFTVQPTTMGIHFAVEQLYAGGQRPDYALQGFLQPNPPKLRLGGGTYIGM